MNSNFKKDTLVLLLCTIFATGQLFAMSKMRSFVVQPHAGQKIKTATPSIIGYLKNANGNPMKQKDVIVVIDGIACGQVRTDKFGVFSYQVRKQIALANGKHEVHAFEKQSLMYIPGGQFTVHEPKTNRVDRSMITRNGDADLSHSYVVVPYEGGAFNSSTPLIIVRAGDVSDAPIVGEHVTIFVDGNQVTSPAIVTDDRGLAIYQLSGAQALSEGAHTIYATCQESSITLTTNNFTVDTVSPAAPVITSPTENETVNSSTVFVVGTAEEFAQITSFMDTDTYGQVGFADENGDWTIEYDDLTNAAHTIKAFATDEAENEGPFSSTIDFTVNA